MTAKALNEDLPEATEGEVSLALAAPAVYANKMIAFGSPLGLRLAFCEAGPNGSDAAAPRASVILSWDDAKTLARIIEQALMQVKGEVVDDK